MPEPLPFNLDDHVHIPTPGDHYSPTTGSAIPTVIYEIARCHAETGGRTRVLVGDTTRKERYSVGECIDISYPLQQNRPWHKIVDACCGHLGLPRHFGSSLYKLVGRSLPPDFSGVLFIHNSPVAPVFRRHYPWAMLCLWAHNELFRHYSNRELSRAVSSIDRLICCSEFLARSIRHRLPDRLQHKVCVVRNGVDTSRFSPAAPDEVGSLPSDPVVLFIGRIVPEKGVDLLVKAAIALKKKGLRFKLRIVGSSNFSSEAMLTPFEQELRSLAVQLGDQVEFLPFVDRVQVVDMYRSGSIFCVPSNWDEPIALTIGEGMACGLPTIASRRGGIPENGGDSVLYFDPPNINELADQIEKLLCNPAARVQWGSRAREQALSIPWENQYQQLRKILESNF